MLTRAEEQALSALRVISKSNAPIARQAAETLRIWPLLRIEDKLNKVESLVKNASSYISQMPWLAEVRDAYEAQSRLYLL